jgi:hypothetical protein
MGEELQKIENHCLRTVSGAYKATQVRSLQAEVGIPPLPLHMDGRQARFFIEVGRVWDRQGDWGRHLEGQTVSQLHQNTLPMP